MNSQDPKRKKKKIRSSAGRSTTHKPKSNKRTSARSGSKNRSRSMDAPKKSAMMESIERTSRLEQTQILRGLTSEIPHIGRDLDAPDHNIFRIIGRRLKQMSGRVHLHPSKVLWIILGVIAALAAAIIIILNVFTVDTVTIEGNVHYTNEEIYSMVIPDDSFLSRSSILLSLKYKNKDIENIPFIQTMNVKITSPSSIHIVVYEKAMAGFVEYKGRYFYFDKDGTVVESSDVITKGIPQIMGLNFDYIVLYEKLPIDNDDVFLNILDITQLLEKYEIEVDKIYFDDNYDVTLYFDEARVKLGDFDNIDEKIIKLKAILPELSGRKGVLRLDNYTSTNTMITFELDEDDTSLETATETETETVEEAE